MATGYLTLFDVSGNGLGMASAATSITTENRSLTVGSGTLTAATGTFTSVGGTLTTVSQPNVTTLGGVTSLNSITVGAGTLSGLTSVAATTGTFTNVGGTLSTVSQPNVTTLGGVTSLNSITISSRTLANLANVSIESDSAAAYLLKTAAGTENGAFGVARGAGQFSNSASAGDIVVRALTTNLILQSGSGNPGVYINTSNNVGIGTSSISGKFQVMHTNGGFFFDGSDSTYNRFKSTTTSAGTGRDLLFSAQDSGVTPDIYIKSDGKVGIGTTTANGLLQFTNTNTNRKIVLYENANNDHQFIGMGVGAGRFQFHADGSTDYVFYSAASSSASTEIMRLYGSNGVLSLGPAIELGAYATGDTTAVIDMHAASGADYNARIERAAGTNGYFQIYNAGTGGFYLTAAGATSMYFRTSTIDRMIIDSTGRVAFNTTPSSGYQTMFYGDPRLASSGCYGIHNNIILGVLSGTGGSCVSLYSNGNYGSNAGTVTNAYNLFLDAGSTAGTITTGYSMYVMAPAYGTTKVCAYFDGQVGMGTNPVSTHKLSVSGTAYLSSGTAWTTSDARVKRDIRDIDSALDTIEKLRPRKFKYREEWVNDDMGVNATDDYFGFIADEVETVLPECVDVNSGMHCYNGRKIQQRREEAKLRADGDKHATVPDPEPERGFENLKNFSMHNISVVGIAAIKEMYQLLQKIDARVAALESNR